MTPPYQASTIARWFIAWAQLEDEAAVSNLKLQKLLYYAQGHYMATHGGTPLFEDRIEAWAHGPVVPSVYHQLKSFGSAPIRIDEDFDFVAEVDEDAGSWLSAIWDTFGSRTAWKLREMTHSEVPWATTWDPDIRGAEITRDVLMRYFSGLYANANPI